MSDDQKKHDVLFSSLEIARRRLKLEAILDRVATIDLEAENPRINILLARSGKEAQEILDALGDDISRLPKYIRVYRWGPVLRLDITLYPAWGGW